MNSYLRQNIGFLYQVCKTIFLGFYFRRDKALMVKIQDHLLNIIEQVENDTKVSEAGKDVFIDYKSYVEKETGNTNVSYSTGCNVG